MDVGEVWQWKFRRKMQKLKICLKITICINVSRFMNLAAIFSLDLESQFNVFLAAISRLFIQALFEGVRKGFLEEKMVRIPHCSALRKAQLSILSEHSTQLPNNILIYTTLDFTLA